MQHIAVCYKWVVDEKDIAVDGEGNLVMRNPAYKVSLYDRNAMEAAVALGEETGAEVVAFTVGDERASRSRKEAMSMGPARGIAVVDPSMGNADGLKTASVLASAIKAKGDFDVVICGEGSGDNYSQQVGPRIAAALDMPFVGYATDIKAEGDTLVLRRACPEGVQTLEATTPLVVSIAGDSNVPRIPGIKQILNAGKKPFELLGLAEVGCGEAADTTQVVEVVGNLPDRKKIILKGDAADIAADLARNLVAEGVLN